jgi:MHS family metabolite:H+ symporter-like MFS transporter
MTDRFGRRKIFLILAGIQLLFAFPGVMLIASGETWAIFGAFVLASGICVQGMYATESAYMVEMFGLRHRLTGVTASKELGGLAGAGVGPLIVAALVAATGHWWVIGAYIALLSLIGFIGALVSPEVAGRDLTLDEDAIGPRTRG